MHFLIKQTFSAKSRIFLISSKFRNFTKVFCICYWESLKYSNKSMIVKVAGRAMMSLLCSVHLLCSDEQVFCTAELLERTTLESRAREVLRSQQDSHLCQRVMFLIHSLSLQLRHWINNRLPVQDSKKSFSRILGTNSTEIRHFRSLLQPNKGRILESQIFARWH